MPRFTGKRKASSSYGSAAKRRRFRPSIMTKTRRMRIRRNKFASRVMRIVNQRAECKEVLMEVAHNQVVKHNAILNLSTNALQTRLGAQGEDFNGGGAGTGSRVGKKIYAKGLSCSIHIENQQYRPDCHYWLYLIRNKFDGNEQINAAAEMFEERTTTLPLDYLDRDKVDVLYCKKFHVKQPNAGTMNKLDGTDGACTGAGTAINIAGSNWTVFGQGVLMKKFYIPLKRMITYTDTDGGLVANTIPIATQRYQWVMIGYNNFSTTTGDGTYPVGHVSLTTKLRFTDV